MSKIVIRAENISKQYTIGAAQQSYGTLRDSLIEGLKKLLPRNSHTGLGQHTLFRRAGKLWPGQATGAAELAKTIWAPKRYIIRGKTG